MYSGLVEPSLLHCCSVCASGLRTKQGQKKLRSIKRKFDVLILKSFPTADTGALSVLAGTIPVDLRVTKSNKRPRIHRDRYPGSQAKTSFNRVTEIPVVHKTRNKKHARTRMEERVEQISSNIYKSFIFYQP